MPDVTHDDIAMERLLAAKPRIAMVGASDNPARDSNSVFRYLVARGYDVTPVNPTTPAVQGIPTVPDLASAAKSGPLGIVDVFRAPDQVMPVVEAAIAAKAPAIWFQLGVVNQPAIDKAIAAGMQVVVDRCIKIEIARLGL